MHEIVDCRQVALQDWMQEIARMTKEKGWRTEESGNREGHEFAAYLMLAVSELSEALEAYRDKVWSETCDNTPTASRPNGHHPICSGKPHGPGKPVGVGPELADTFIRLLDMADIWDVDMFYEIERVMAYGWTRSFRHGGRQL
jgi:NTP pyrophosphatase (non-canonical NTP hydrolase)